MLFISEIFKLLYSNPPPENSAISASLLSIPHSLRTAENQVLLLEMKENVRPRKLFSSMIIYENAQLLAQCKKFGDSSKKFSSLFRIDRTKWFLHFPPSQEVAWFSTVREEWEIESSDAELPGGGFPCTEYEKLVPQNKKCLEKKKR